MLGVYIPYPSFNFLYFRIIESASKSENVNNSKFISKFIPSNETVELSQVKFLCVQNHYYLGLGLHGGFQLWSSEGSRLLTQIPMKNQIQDRPYTFNAFCEYKVNPKSTTHDSIICADSYGQMFILMGSDMSWKTKLIYNNSLTATDITYEISSHVLACAYETGDVFIMNLKNDGNIEVLSKLDNPYGLPCLCVRSVISPKPLLITGNISGEVRIFNLKDNYDLVCSIGAHTRLITSMSTYNNYIITCAEDEYVNVWKINTDGKVTNSANLEIPNRIPTGLTIVPVNENKINVVVACYDYQCLIYLDNINL